MGVEMKFSPTKLTKVLLVVLLLQYLSCAYAAASASSEDCGEPDHASEADGILKEIRTHREPTLMPIDLKVLCLSYAFYDNEINGMCLDAWLGEYLSGRSEFVSPVLWNRFDFNLW